MKPPSTVPAMFSKGTALTPGHDLLALVGERNEVAILGDFGIGVHGDGHAPQQRSSYGRMYSAICTRRGGRNDSTLEWSTAKERLDLGMEVEVGVADGLDQFKRYEVGQW